MSKILHNATGGTIFVNDTGVSIASGANYVIPPQDYLLWAASNNVITFIGAGDLIVNDGSSNLSISDGTDLIKGIFPTTIKAIPWGSIEPVYAEITSIASGVTSDVLSFNAVSNTRAVIIAASGSNIAIYTIKLNGTVIDKAYTNFGSSLSTQFDFSTGLSLTSGDVLKVQVLHNRPYLGDFNAKLILENL